MTRLFHTRALVLLLLILAAATAVRVYAFSGYVGLDDAEYARFAVALAEGRDAKTGYTGPAVFPLRVGTFVPTAAFFKMFGVNEWAMVAYPFIASLASIVVIYIAAALFFGWEAGLLAAALLGSFYWDIDTATKLLPDLPSGFYAFAGVTLLVWLERKRPELEKWPLALGGLAAGLAFGLSWLSKETVAYLGPFVFALILLTLTRSRPRVLYLWLGFIVGSGLVLFGEVAVYSIAKGDPLFRFHEVERNYHQWENGFFSEGSDMGWAPGTSRSAALLNRLFVSGPAALLLEPSFYYVPLLGLIAAVYGWLRKDRAFLIPGLWLVSLLLIFNFASSSTAEYVPLALFRRYLYPIYYPAIILIAGFLAQTVLTRPFSLERPRLIELGAGIAVVLVLLWSAAPNLYFGVLVRPSNWADEVRRFKNDFRPDTPLYSDALTLRALEFFAGYPTRTSWIGFEQIASEEDIPAGGTVIVNQRYIEWLNRNGGMWVAWPAPGQTDRSGYRRHEFYGVAPNTWTEVWKNDNARIYKVGALPQHASVSGLSGGESR